MKTAPSGTIISFSAGVVAVTGEGEARQLPTEIVCGRWGETDTRKGLVVCNATTAAVLPHNQEANKRWPRVALDFEHNTVPGTPAYKGEPAPVAAWGDLSVVPGRGVILSALEWTPEGKAHVLGGHANGVSPAAQLNDKGEIIFVHSVGLCRHQEMGGLKLFTADNDISNLITTDPNAEMKPKDIAILVNIFLVAAGLAAVSEDASVEDIQKAANEGAEKIKAMKPSEGEKTETFNATVNELRTSFQDMVKRLNKSEKDRVLDAAIRDGKIVAFTAEQIDGMDLQTFTAHVEKLEPNQVPLDKRTVEGLKTFSAGGYSDGAPSDAALARMGLSKEDFVKYGPKN